MLQRFVRRISDPACFGPDSPASFGCAVAFSPPQRGAEVLILGEEQIPVKKAQGSGDKGSRGERATVKGESLRVWDQDCP
jgi:hypothetical protein